MQRSMGGFLLVLVTLSCAVAACGHKPYLVGRACAAGSVRPCYTGPEGTEGVGACKGGVQMCLADESGWGACSDVTPRPETCETSADDDCDGRTNEEGEGCECAPEETEACYTGPKGTEGVGLCAAGSRVCSTGSWAACIGQVLPGEEDCDGPGDEDCDGVECAGPLWGALYGNADAQAVGGIASDAKGHPIVAGSFVGSIKIDGTTLIAKGDRDAFVAKLDTHGAVVWARAYGGAKADEATAVAVDLHGDVIVVGAYKSSDMGELGLDPAVDEDAFVAKLDGITGAVKWRLRLGETGNGAASSVATDANGEVYVGGSFEGYLYCGAVPPCVQSAGGYDGFLVRVSAAGEIVWVQREGGTSVDAVNAIATDAAGNVFAAGVSSNDAMWGTVELQTTGVLDLNFFVVKVSADGVAQWGLISGDNTPQSADGIAATPEGDAIVVGQTFGNIHLTSGDFGSSVHPAFIAKVSAAGTAVWGKAFGSYSGPARANAVSVDAAGHIAVAGATAGTIDLGAGNVQAIGKSDAFLVKLDPDGGYLWSKQLGAPGATHVGRAVAFTPGGDVLFAADVSGSIDFGLGALSSAGATDIGVAAFAP